MISLAFDIYGTLINPLGISEQLKKTVGKHAQAVATLWREKQLEYTFRRALMQDYYPFTTCVQQALQYCLDHFELSVSAEKIEELMQLYLELPAFPDAQPCLEKLDREKFQVNALTNGYQADITQLLQHNHLENHFNKIISVDAIKTFKPDPAVYQFLLQECDTRPSDSWLISSNPFDIAGAKAVGMNTAWIQRDSKTVFDPWEHRPDIILNKLDNLQEAILEFSTS